MSVNLKFKTLFVYSESKAKYFNADFDDGVNIVHGRNTSGKSTLFLSILYSFGINDGSQYLREILSEDVLFRVDCILTKDGTPQKLTLIRDDETLVIKIDNKPIKRFNGISGNNSVEHVKLKHYLNEIFDFSMLLESKGEYKQAPIETMFLPYYVSQTVGWTYLRKSFSSLDFFRNFKEDYLDYYLGLEPSVDRVKRHDLEAKLKSKKDEVEVLTSFEANNEGIQLSKLSDEQFMSTSQEYIQSYTERHKRLTDRENEYVLKCNELAFLEERQTTLRKVKTNHQHQKPEVNNCPTCSQSLPFGIAESYIFFQQENDTAKEFATVKAKIKDVQSEINSLQKSINSEREIIAQDYLVLNKHFHNGITYETWLKHKANKELNDNLQKRVGELTVQKEGFERDLKEFKTEDEIQKSRILKGNLFEIHFADFLKKLQVKPLEDDRYVKLYQITFFPSQGVELHKTTMAYHFAFNSVIAENPDVHRFPFMLDAIFKEDLDDDNKDIILAFISKNKPTDTQIILAIAQTKNQLSNAAAYNKKHFNDKAKLIQIGDGTCERCFLQEYKDTMQDYIEETMKIMGGEI
jgi:hypothetical protein